MGIEQLKIGSVLEGPIFIKKTNVLEDVFASMSSEKKIDFYFSERQSGMTSSYLLYLLKELEFSFSEVNYLVVSHHSNCANGVNERFWDLLCMNNFECPQQFDKNKVSYKNNSSVEFVGFNDWLDEKVRGRRYETIIFDNYTYYSHRVVFCKFAPRTKKIRCFSTYE